MSLRTRGFTMLELLIVVLLLGAIMAIAIPNLLAARKTGNEACAVGSLKSISTAQRLFREKDKDGNGLYDYGSLTDLATAGVIDTVLGTGTKQGYTFQTEAGSSGVQYMFWATAYPSVPGGTGDRYFATNHAGVIYYTGISGGPIVPNPADGAITAGQPIQ